MMCARCVIGRDVMELTDMLLPLLRGEVKRMDGEFYLDQKLLEWTAYKLQKNIRIDFKPRNTES